MKRIDSWNLWVLVKELRFVLHEIWLCLLCFCRVLIFKIQILQMVVAIMVICDSAIINNERNNKRLNSYGSNIFYANDKDSKGLINRQMKKKKCFICNGYIDSDNNLVAYLLKLNEINNSKSDIIYCYNCLENFRDEVFKKYQDKFMNDIG